MNSVVIFDVSNNGASVVKEGMRAKGYNFTWSAQTGDQLPKSYYLPHNVVWKPNTETQQALSDLNQVIAQINLGTAQQIALLRCIVLNSTPWSGISGTPII